MKTSNLDPPKLRSPLGIIKEYLEIDLTRAVRWLSTPPSFSLWLGEVRIDLGGIEALMSQSRFRKCIFQTTKVMPRRIHERDWDSFLNVIGEVLEDIEVPTTTELEVLQQWIGSYLESKNPGSEAEGEQRWQDRLIQQHPVVAADGVYINSVALQMHIEGVFHERVTQVGLNTKLKLYGCEMKKFQWRAKSSVFTRRYWLLPRELTPDWALAMMPKDDLVEV